MHAFILAGGFATRLWPLTEKRAKPLLPIAGKPILTHLVEKIPAEIPVTVSTNAAFDEVFNEWKKDLNRPNLEIVVEGTKHDDEKLGALGAVAQWIIDRSLKEDILLLTGDNYLGFSMQKFLDTYRDGIPLLAAYDIKDLAKASAFGTVIVAPDASKAVLGFEEKPIQAKTTLVSTGCSIIPKEYLPVLTEYARAHKDNVGGIFEEFLRRSIPIDSFIFTEPWLDIGSFPAYLEAHRLLVGSTPIVHPTAKVAGSTLEGSIAIDRDTRVEGSTLTDCMIFRNCEITDCVLRECIIDEGCTLRGVDLTGKMIRAGSRLEK